MTLAVVDQQVTLLCAGIKSVIRDEYVRVPVIVEIGDHDRLPEASDRFAAKLRVLGEVAFPIAEEQERKGSRVGDVIVRVADEVEVSVAVEIGKPGVAGDTGAGKQIAEADACRGDELKVAQPIIHRADDFYRPVLVHVGDGGGERVVWGGIVSRKNQER